MEMDAVYVEELCFHPDPRGLFSPSVKSNQQGGGDKKGTLVGKDRYITQGALWSGRQRGSGRHEGFANNSR